MSVVPLDTQFVNSKSKTQKEDEKKENEKKKELNPEDRVFFIHTTRITERQSALMSEAQQYQRQGSPCLAIKSDEIDKLPNNMRFFVIPCRKTDLINKIRSRFPKHRIYLPRAIIESRRRKVRLPARTFVISLTMQKCRVFLVKTCDDNSIRNKIFEMSGTVVPDFFKGSPNVVITDRADDIFCSRAFKSNIPVVSRDWVDDNYNVANEEESELFNQDALLSLSERQIGPFFGLQFKIALKESAAQIKPLIIENQGRIVYSDENCATHIVTTLDSHDDLNDHSGGRLKKVDVEFLKLCAEFGHYLTKKEYLRQKNNTSQGFIKQEPQSHCGHHLVFPKEEVVSQRESNINSYVSDSENRSMPPPMFNSRPLKSQQQADVSTNDILRAMSNCDTAQTQLASTQMRRLPDSELLIEPTFEPSQQLSWEENVYKRD